MERGWTPAYVFKVDHPLISRDTYIGIYEWIPPYCYVYFPDHQIDVLRAHTGLKPFYEEYLELRVWIYEWVRHITFYSCALRGADDENKQWGLIHVKFSDTSFPFA